MIESAILIAFFLLVFRVYLYRYFSVFWGSNESVDLKFLISFSVVLVVVGVIVFSNCSARGSVAVLARQTVNEIQAFTVLL